MLQRAGLSSFKTDSLTVNRLSYVYRDRTKARTCLVMYVSLIIKLYLSVVIFSSNRFYHKSSCNVRVKLILVFFSLFTCCIWLQISTV